jgi:hypothetical protein
MEQDGTQLQFKSVTQNAYVAAENGGGGVLIANRPSASGWETFKLWRIDQNTFNLRVFSNQFDRECPREQCGRDSRHAGVVRDFPVSAQRR